MKNRKTEIEESWKPWIEIVRNFKIAADAGVDKTDEMIALIESAKGKRKRRLVAAALNVANEYLDRNGHWTSEEAYLFSPLCLSVDSCVKCFARNECLDWFGVEGFRDKEVKYTLAMKLYRRLYYQ